MSSQSQSNTTPPPAQAATLADFRDWVRSLDQDTLDNYYGVSSAEETLRLVRGYENMLARRTR